MSSSSRTPMLLGITALLACVTAVMWPCMLHGFSHGADADFHATAWTDVAHQWREGTIWPRWGARFAYGYGEPVYIFYPPFSIALGALCTKIFGGGTAPIVLSYLALMLAGWNMRSFAGDFTDEAGAWIAACAYAANPYFILCVWIRNSFAELLAAAIFPLVVKYALKLETRIDIAKLALAYAAVWFTNFPAAVITTYAVLVLLTVKNIDDHRWIKLVRGGAAVSLGLGTAAWTIFPAWYEQRWVQIAFSSTDYYLYWKHWLWGGGADKDDVDFTHWMTVAAASLIAVAVSAIVARFARREKFKDSQLAILVLWAVSGMLMFRLTHYVWAVAPLLSKVQFPWRWMFVVAFTAAMLAAFLLDQLRWKIAVSVALLVGGVWIGKYFYEQTDWQDVWTNDYVAKQHYLVDEYLPLGVKGSALRLSAEQGKRGTLDFPAWKRLENDRTESAKLEAGTHILPASEKLTFTRTWDRTLGGVVSILGLCVCGILLRKK